MFDQSVKRPRGQPRKAPEERQRAESHQGAEHDRLCSDNFFALCNLSLAWQEEHHAVVVRRRK